MNKYTQQGTWRSAARTGAKIGLRLTFTYAVVFALYAIARSSMRIRAVAPDDAWQVMFGTGVTLAFGILVFATVLALVSAAIGALSGVALSTLLTRLNPRHSPRKALTIGLLMGVGCWLVGNSVLLTLPGSRLTPGYLETYVFWFALPGLVFVAASILVSRMLNSVAD